VLLEKLGVVGGGGCESYVGLGACSSREKLKYRKLSEVALQPTAPYFVIYCTLSNAKGFYSSRGVCWHSMD
jgi:hypothetical protein